MILPGKHLKEDRALLSVGGDILSVLTEPMPFSVVWEKVRVLRAMRSDASPLPFDWFVLAVSLLYAMYAINAADDVLIPRSPS